MKKRYCNLCENLIEKNNGPGVSFEKYDLCNECTKLARIATCKLCNGTGKKSVCDNEATLAQASCGENRTQYKTIPCHNCHIRT